MKMYFRPGLACAALLLAGCSATPIKTSLAGSPGVPKNFEQALTYHVFMGELALQRGDARTAVQQYAVAAQASTDPSLSGYATLLAYKYGDDRLTLDLTHHWLHLAPEDSSARHFEAVLNARLGNVDLAASEFEAILKDTPGENLQLVGGLLGQETDASHGLAVMQQLVSEQSQSAQAHFALAQLAMHYQRAPLAIDEARRALALNPDWDEALILECRGLLADGKNHAALHLLEARAHSEPDNLRIDLAYASVLAQAGHADSAMVEFTTIIKSYPGNAEALYSLGLLALQDNQLNVARDYFVRLLKTGRRDNDARYFLGYTAELAKRYPVAQQWYQQVTGGRNWLPARINFMRVLIIQGKLDAVRAYIDDTAGIDPDDSAQLRIAEAQLFSAAGDDKTALLVCDQGLKENPGDLDLLYQHALGQDNLGNSLAAEDDLRHILDRQPDNADVLNALGYMLTLHSTRYQEALGYIGKALQLKPDDPAIVDSMGWVEYRLGNYTQALDYLRTSYARLADPEVAAHLTEVLLAAGDKLEARRIWSRALSRRFSP
jgi:tetratricopeptide (TPR) repeat protein